MKQFTTIGLLVLASLLAVGLAANDPNCGTKGPRESSKIVGGVNAKPLEFPWQGSLQYKMNGFHFCGCSLINKRWVLTAAHCVAELPEPAVYMFVGGKHNISDIDETTQVQVSLEKIIIHPKWNDATIDEDCALLKLSRDLDLEGSEKHLGTVCLPDEESNLEEMAGKECIATGWGDTKYLGTSPDILQKVSVKVVSQAVCQNTYKSHINITKNMICFGEDGKGTCQGDSGGPLNCQVDGKWYTYGATSFAMRCAGPIYPSVSSRISSFSNWIWNTIDQEQN